jgi:transposase
MLGADPDHGMMFSLSPGQTSDIKAGHQLLRENPLPPSVTHLAMDKGYSAYKTIELCTGLGIEAVVPPKKGMKHPWQYDRNVYLYRNEIERLFNRIKNFRRIATRYDKLDFMYGSFVFLGLIALLLKVIC